MTARDSSPLVWHEVRRLFEETVDLAPAGRRTALARAEREDAAGAAITREVGRLLEAADTGPHLLDETAADLLEASAHAGGARAAAAHDLLGEEVGGYVLRARISSGGMGDVYRGEREVGSASRQVAVKILKRGLDTAALLRRFRREQETLAALHHEHVVGFLDAGSLADGRPWFVMEHVDGAPIHEACATMDLDARVALFAVVCDAVQFAHRNLVLHRDLKPSNILVTASGTPKLLDFGVAALLQADGGVELTDATRTAVPLTPRYASPEQLRDEHVAVPSDVYALGLVLFEVLTGRPARPADSLVEILDSAGDALPAPSSVADTPTARLLRGDLDAIVRKATHALPDHRYASAEALATDLRRWQAGEPVSAHPETGWERASRFVKQHRLGVGLVSLLILLLAAGLIGTWIGKQRALTHASRGWGAHSEARVATRFLEQWMVERLGGSGNASTAGSSTAAPPLPPLYDDPAVETRIRDRLATRPEAEVLVRIALGRLALTDNRPDIALRQLDLAMARTGPETALGSNDEARLQHLRGRAQAALGMSEATGTLRLAVERLRTLTYPEPDAFFEARVDLARLLLHPPPDAVQHADELAQGRTLRATLIQEAEAEGSPEAWRQLVKTLGQP